MPIREISEDFSIDDIVPYFQPIVDLQSQGIWRYECLARLIIGVIRLTLNFSTYRARTTRKYAAASMFVQCTRLFSAINILGTSI